MASVTPTSASSATAIQPKTAASKSSSITASIDSLIKKATEARQVTASIDTKSGGLDSKVTSTGNDSLFSAAEKSLGKQDFLNLLVTQLKYQDPLSPSENTEFVAQLAQFSALEGTQNISESVDKMSENMEGLVERQEASGATLAEATAVGLVGKKARLKLNELQWDPKMEMLKFNVHAPAGKDVLIAFTNEKGEAINYAEANGGGDREVVWSGHNFDKSRAKSGTYGVKVVSRNDLSTEVGYVYLEEKVKAVNYTSEGIKLSVGNQEVPFDQVASLLSDDEPETASEKASKEQETTTSAVTP
jgi:flagellar basal-body rod modification protein FlgD